LAETDPDRVARQPVFVALALLIVVIVSLVAAGGYAVWRIYSLGNHRFIDQAGPFFAVTEDLANEMLNEETAVRGYVITSDRATLAPYRQGLKYTKLELALIKKDEAFDPRIPRDLARMTREVDALQKFYGREVALVKSGPAGQKRAASDTLIGKNHFDHLRGASRALIADAAAVIKRSHDEQHGTLVGSIAFLGIVGALALALTIGLLLFVPRRLLGLVREEREARHEAQEGADASRALAHVRDAVLLLDRDGALRYANPAARTLFADADVDAVLEELRQGNVTAAGPRPVSLAGRERWLTFAETPFDGGHVAVLRDVSEDMRLERLRADFVATAAHELRTPLAAVYGAVRTLRHSEHELSEEISAQFLAMIEDEAERLKLVMDQLLVSAQLDRDEVTLHQEVVDIAGLCKSVVGAVDVRKPERIELGVDAPENAVEVDADGERLRQVVANLLDNAIKYSPGGGRVEVRVGLRGGSGTIEVSDHGLGIPVHEQQRIFEKFYRLDPSMTRGIGGSGLGLYISRELVRQMGGEIRVESKLGEGSTFTVLLPLTRIARLRLEERAAVSGSANPPRLGPEPSAAGST
jgi:signal transduction histidine kinase